MQFQPTVDREHDERVGSKYSADRTGLYESGFRNRIGSRFRLKFVEKIGLRARQSVCARTKRVPWPLNNYGKVETHVPDNSYKRGRHAWLANVAVARMGVDRHGTCVPRIDDCVDDHLL